MARKGAMAGNGKLTLLEKSVDKPAHALADERHSNGNASGS
eukprot:CAMPEP_0179016674 /NCGR_PEP_ID=MMETSP0796-20121207/3444_1 /TAXON_ID=73915 /ORGANISM="Pyrodinium bahamense, Strain pbaha01" /LENGTH=40 /DNA_ID= /DNA_START= /DNA_END= /DNA_ORIENTATION=